MRFRVVGYSELIVGPRGEFLISSLPETDPLLILTNVEDGDAAEGRRVGQAIFRGGQTRTSCLRAKCRSGCGVSAMPKDSVIELRANSASVRCRGQGG